MKSLNEFSSKEEYNLYLRTYFAAMALSGYISSGCFTTESTAKAAVQYADALIAELEKPQS